MASKDYDGIYQEALHKLRMLLSASEVASSMDEEEEEKFVAQNTMTDPPKLNRRFIRNPKARKKLFRNRERCNSWHNLTHIDSNDRGTDFDATNRAEELALLTHQEKYIKQLEREMIFCREQLAFVLSNVKGVLNNEKKSEVNKATSNVFSAVEETTAATLKLRKDNTLLSDSLQRLRIEVEEVRTREEEAAEEVKRSVQVAEQLRMEKAEMDYEIGQLKIQVDRQQQRIRTLIEEQVTKIDDERAIIEKRCIEQVRGVREDANKQLEEMTRISSEAERLQRVEADLRRQIQDRDKVLDDVRVDSEKKLGHLQLEIARLNASREELEQSNAGLRLDIQHEKRQRQSEVAQVEAEAKSLRSRVSKVEEQLLQTREEAIDLAEEKASLEKELGILRINANQRRITTDPPRDITKLENSLRRQSQIISELRHQCLLVTDRLETSAQAWAHEKSELVREISRLGRVNALTQTRCQNLERHMEERSRLHERLCQKVESADSALRQAHLDYDELRREKSAAQGEFNYIKDIFRTGGPLPEKEKDPRKQAIVVERNGRVTSPFLK